ncbi:DUF6777 domain-containing protein [Streptomyces sp. NRRL S-118]|uniref:DUF6777 domain-containing protein n=1 Tax=Streptomyces sp. NRRL S-118 TaxID=1463881 RepID=UPI0007C76769|nr:DUF6777 domain-containing protein [Streptomyces sp. NRRL S-118]
MRTTTRRRRCGAVAAVTAGLLVAGCGSDGEGRPAEGPGAQSGLPGPRDVLLQPAAAHGPAPFTPSTVRPSPDAASAPPSAGPGAPPVTGIVSGATPGLYGGARSVASCDVERQVRLLTSDRARTAAFAQAAGVSPTRLAPWLRGLTPVVLRSDTRVTGHGYREDSAAPFQAVLQAGTAVLVDEYGAPRVRCASGSPLRSPASDDGGVEHKGQPWPGFDPGRVVTVTATQHVVESLLIVSVVSNTLIERRTGTDGEKDRIVTDESVLNRPAEPPPQSAEPLPVAPQPVGPTICPTDPPAPPGCPAPPSVDPEPEFHAGVDRGGAEEGAGGLMGPDNGMDAGPDAGPDGGIGSVPDDDGSFSGADAGLEAEPDAGPDDAPDAGPDEGPGAGPDEGPDEDLETEMGAGGLMGPDAGPGEGLDDGAVEPEPYEG